MKDYIQKIINVFTASRHSKDVTGEVHQWLVDKEHAEEKETALRTLWNETEGKVDAGTWLSLANVYEKVGTGKKSEVRFRVHFLRYAAAAVLLIAVSVSTTFFLTKKEYGEVAMVENLTHSGKMNYIQLPDGSMVQTNSGTILLYPERFKGDTRTVYLIGEANFKVKKNPRQPFIVRSTTMSVTALGTEFNVTAYPDNNEMIATLINGKVKVDCNNGRENYMLVPGQQITYSRSTGKSVLSDANLEDVTAWQRGQIVFRGNTLEEILLTLERRFAITFQYNLELFTPDKYNFSFRKDADIAEIMEVMKEVTGRFTYKLDGNICYLKMIK
jgi:Fe2+-dicitrate sensor, membrane component